MKCASAVIDFCKQGGFNIVTVLGDNAFSYLEECLDEKHNIDFNTPSANENAREIEDIMRMAKELIRAIKSCFLWKKQCSKINSKNMQ